MSNFLTLGKRKRSLHRGNKSIQGQNWYQTFQLKHWKLKDDETKHSNFRMKMIFNLEFYA